MSLKQIIKRYVPYTVYAFVRNLVYPEKINVLEDKLNTLFFISYQNIALSVINQKQEFRNVEFKVYSKHGADGIIAHIFSKVGVKNHTFVEVGVEDGRECNTANLSLNFGWRGLLIDTNENWIQSAKKFYGEKLGEDAGTVKAVASYATAENINQTLEDNGFNSEIDLLSIDIDSNDYYLWQAITVINPRVVVIEYNSAFGLRSMTIKYDPNFYFKNLYQEYPLYSGTSLTALAKLGKKKGYILVACDVHGHDAYFVRSDIATGKFIELTPEQAFYPNPLNIRLFGNTDAQFETIKSLDFEEIK